MNLTVLGSATPYPAVGNPCSGFLVSHEDTRLWMDAGTGTLGDRVGVGRARTGRRAPGAGRRPDFDEQVRGARHPAFAVRIEAEGKSLVYSGDTAPCANLTSLAADCDTLLCEADGLSGDGVHHTPADAGDTARSARARRLIVTHVGRSLTPELAVGRATAKYDGPVDYAAPGRVFA